MTIASKTDKFLKVVFKKLRDKDWHTVHYCSELILFQKDDDTIQFSGYDLASNKPLLHTIDKKIADQHELYTLETFNPENYKTQLKEIQNVIL
jgi:hypothetical protein